MTCDKYQTLLERIYVQLENITPEEHEAMAEHDRACDKCLRVELNIAMRVIHVLPQEQTPKWLTPAPQVLKQILELERRFVLGEFSGPHLTEEEKQKFRQLIAGIKRPPKSEE